ncbi:hypothetical protein Tco_0130940 [Tanacetum coccineum]
MRSSSSFNRSTIGVSTGSTGLLTEQCLPPTILLLILRKLSPHYFPATLENNSPDSSNDFTKYLLDILVFSPLHDDPIVEIMQAYDATDNELPTLPLQTIIALPTIIPSMFDSRDFIPPERISPKDTETSKSPTPVSSSSSIGSSSPVASTAPSLVYLFDESIFAKLDNSLWIISRPLGEEPNPEKLNELDAYDYLWK